MARVLDTGTLDRAGQDYASWFMADRLPFDREYVMEQFHNFTFRDEFDHMIAAVQGNLGSKAGKDFTARVKALQADKPRDDAMFHRLLADKLAIDANGKHIPGKIGAVDLGSRVVGKGVTLRGRPKNLYWPVYAGEGDERAADSGVADPLPLHAEPLPVGALNTRISNEVAQLMANAGVDNLDEGTLGAVIQGRTGAQPADPDTAVTGTNLFTLTCSDPAFGAATDAAPGALKTANAITDDTSADATGTLGYCRASSSSVAVTPLDDHIDGEAGTSGADFNFNTLSIVAGATVSMTSWTVTMPEA